ncbi:MAG: proteasome endopeptidase complex, archaeal, beta subunit [Thermoplasmata archaeon]|nr:MAG: proteasome endopeptidase complex, archaeal, beta subunit [Thermoplasmata archaeon]
MIAVEKHPADVNKTGTTTVALKYSDGVVVAADKRASAGTYIASKTARKILQVDEHMVLTISGYVGDAQYLARLADSEARYFRMRSGKRISVKALSTLLSNYLNYYRYVPYVISLILAGYDDTGSHVFQIDLDGGILEEEYTATGSGSIVAIGVLDDRYKKGMTLDEALELAIRAIARAMGRDAATGDGIDVAYVNAEGVHYLRSDEIEQYLSRIKAMEFSRTAKLI